ncbi:T cell receptor alpha variable 19 [Lemmus lemmus]
MTQVQSSISTQQRVEVNLHCSYKTSQNLFYIFWYKRHFSGEIIFLLC